jgi:hypothetical protein
MACAATLRLSAAAAHDRRLSEPDLWAERWAEVERRIDLPLHGLRELTDLRAALDRLERELVASARGNWSTWEEIGGALGISRQAAHARHGPFVKRKGGV